jgi:hypothetical protein
MSKPDAPHPLALLHTRTEGHAADERDELAAAAY